MLSSSNTFSLSWFMLSLAYNVSLTVPIVTILLTLQGPFKISPPIWISSSLLHQICSFPLIWTPMIIYFFLSWSIFLLIYYLFLLLSHSSPWNSREFLKTEAMCYSYLSTQPTGTLGMVTKWKLCLDPNI